jgi:hypothetical protein
VLGPQAAAQGQDAERLALDQLYEPGAAAANVPLYTARGIYSLPVTLPRSTSSGQAPGEVRLDFARPSGEAELSLWAVPVSTIANLYETIAIVAGLLAIAVLAKIWPQPQNKQPMSAKHVISYALLLVVLTLVLGLLGLLISLFIVLLSEARRGAFIHSTIDNVQI